MKRANAVELDKVFALLREHCKRGADNAAVYDSGWDDQRVASECGVEVAVVRYRRQQVYGHVRVAEKPNDTQTSIAELRSIVNGLTTRQAAARDELMGTRVALKRVEDLVVQLYAKMGEPLPTPKPPIDRLV
jgi:hypothetical protein